MAGELEGRTVAFLATDGVEQVELTEPWRAVADAGGTPMLVSIKSDEIEAWKHFDKADHFPVDLEVDAARPESFDALVLPGGVANPDQLRTNEGAVALVDHFARQNKPIAAICHGPWLLAEADVVRNRTMTSWPSLHTDLTNAGATWTDEEVVTCHEGPMPLITSRNPDDLPAFCEALVREFAAAPGRNSG